MRAARDGKVGLHRGPSAHDPAGLEGVEDHVEDVRRELAVGVEEDEVAAPGFPGSRVPGPGDLIHGLEDHPRSSVAGYLGGLVARVVVADDDLAHQRCLLHGAAHRRERRGEQTLLVEGRNDDREVRRVLQCLVSHGRRVRGCHWVVEGTG